jgi:3-oxoadipate enol-lactonase
MADYADDAAALMAEVGWDSCLVVGASFGGMVAQELAIRHGPRVRRLVLACTSSGGAGGASYPLQNLATLEGEERVALQLELLDTRWDETYRRDNPDQWKAMVDGFAAYLKGQEDPDSSERARGAELQLDARSRHDTADRLGTISCPTLVCAGRFDGIAPMANSEYLAAAIAGAQLKAYDGGHQFMVQDRQAIPDMIEFLIRP